MFSMNSSTVPSTTYLFPTAAVPSDITEKEQILVPERYSENNDMLSDIVLIVEDQKLHVSKTVSISCIFY